MEVKIQCCLRRYLDDQLLLVIESVYDWGDEDVEVADSRSPSSVMIEEIQRERMGKWEWVTVHWVNRVILEGSGHWVKN
ncbi:hypothetical protein H5410_053224 [Solanum commersonii]|uniref:Uncharacterized protein n=1 Tax=Solanum commersonii TaxID=4109 RepID=A0A9J5X5D5_SOLCO|nr:hypothetical protein H5410_053224 [Solanum commersonii]